MNQKELLKSACTLSRLGVTPNYTGFSQTSYAIALAVREPWRLQFVTKWLYPDVAKHYNTNIRCIERNIRTVCKVAWDRNPSRLINMAQYPLSKQPSTTEFLAILTAHISLEEITEKEG